MDMLFKQQRRVLKLVIAPTNVPREKGEGGRGNDEGETRDVAKGSWGSTVEMLGYNVSTT